MARLNSSGFELNSTTSNVEWTSIASSSILSSGVRSGTYVFNKPTVASSKQARFSFASSNQTAAFYFRIYFYLTTATTTTIDIMSFLDATNNVKTGIKLTSANVLQLFNLEDSTQIGSNSPALNTGQWYRIELKTDTTTIASTSVEGLIDGVSFASGTANLANGVAGINVGQVTANDTGVVYSIDDVAINNSSGSFQNSWPGEGEIIHLRPNAAGDNAGWNDGTTDLYSSIDEVTPNDATDFIGSTDANAISDFNLDDTPAALASDDTINCVQVGWRFNDSSSSFDHGVKLRIKASSSGTVEESAEQIIPDTTWRTNKIASPFNYHLTLYDLPGASTTGWTKADLDTAQIGAENSTDQLGNAQISTMWLLVDHKPAAGGAATVTHLLGSTGVGG